MRKSLWDDPRVRLLSRKLRTPRGQVVGALFRLWSLAVVGLARVLRIPRKWLINEADLGRLPFLRVGKGRRLFSDHAVRPMRTERAPKARYPARRPCDMRNVQLDALDHVFLRLLDATRRRIGSERGQ